jgi:basic membrane protein A
MLRRLALALLATASLALPMAASSLPAAAQNFVPAVIFDMGGKFDKSFNEEAYNGAERFKKETGIAYREFEVTNETQRTQALQRLARGAGSVPPASIVVAVGFSFGSTLEQIAKDFPNTKFVIVDSVVDAPNVQSVVFREHEGSFLVGMAAAMASKTGKVGFIGGMDIPLIRKFHKGYEEGVLFVKKDAQVFMNMTGTTPAAWNDPTKGGELARSQFERGADIVYAAAGGTGTGVLQAAKDAGKFSIGVDSNQNHLHPGSVLTSMVKRVDVAVYNAFKSAQSGTWKPGMLSLGLKEDGVGYAADSHNAMILTTDMKARLDSAKADIIAGKIKVTDVTAK